MTARDIHTYFGLSYANYLVLHRTLLQSMPLRWQREFTTLVTELEEAFDHVPQAEGYEVTAVEDRLGGLDDGEREWKAVPVPDPVPHYRHHRIEPKPSGDRTESSR